MFFVYVLQDKNGKVYKGQTEDLVRRFREHCSGHTKSTKGMIGAKIVYVEKYETRKEAILREKYLKSATGRRFLKNKMRP
jgi:putative endonuclease